VREQKFSLGGRMKNISTSLCFSLSCKFSITVHVLMVKKARHNFNDIKIAGRGLLSQGLANREE
jgi:hypothetical protein